jgi:hypothetical protein
LFFVPIAFLYLWFLALHVSFALARQLTEKSASIAVVWWSVQVSADGAQDIRGRLKQDQGRLVILRLFGRRSSSTASILLAPGLIENPGFEIRGASQVEVAGSIG